MIKTPNQLCMQNLSQISGPVCLKNPFKKLEYHAVSHADIEIFSVENDRLTNVLLMDGCLGRHSRLINETK